MEEKLLNAIERISLLDGVKDVTVALSGGADSMALLHLLSKLKEKLGISLSAAHFNHKIRGEEADRDEAFVKEQCEKLGVPVFVGCADVPSFAKKNGLSIELAARKLRYEFLDSVAKGVIATAHTASDNLETMLFNLTRGTAAKGLSGIPVKRDNIIRPIILCTRDEIELYCKENNISFVTDSTNLCDEYSRNKLRHKVVPILRELNSSAENNALRAALSISEDNDFLDTLAREEFNLRIKNNKLDVNGFNRLHKALQNRIIKFFFDCLGCEIDYLHLSEVRRIACEGGKTQINGEISTICRKGVLEVLSSHIYKFDVEIIEEKINFSENNQKIHNLLLKNAIDCDKIVGKLILRTRNPQDAVKLYGRNCTKTLKKLFTEKQIPMNERENLPVAADELGVVWVYGIGVAERCAVDKNTNSIFKFQVSKK